MRTSANTSTPRSSAMRSISPSRQRQLRSTSSSPERPHQLGTSVFRSRARAVHGRLNGTVPPNGLLPMSGILFVVATPIGNLADASARSLEVLRGADLVACEDTRTTRTLLARYGIADADRRAAPAQRARGVGQAAESAQGRKAPGFGERRRHAGAVRPGCAAGGGRASRRHPGEPGARPERGGGGIFGGRIRRRPFSVCRLPARLRRSPQEGPRGPRGRLPADRVRSATPDSRDRAGPRRALRSGARDCDRPRAHKEIRGGRENEARPTPPAGCSPSRPYSGRIRAGPCPGRAQDAQAKSMPSAYCRRCSRSMAPSEAARLAARITGHPRRLLYQKATARAK